LIYKVKDKIFSAKSKFYFKKKLTIDELLMENKLILPVFFIICLKKINFKNCF